MVSVEKNSFEGTEARSFLAPVFSNLSHLVPWFIPYNFSFLVLNLRKYWNLKFDFPPRSAAQSQTKTICWESFHGLFAICIVYAIVPYRAQASSQSF